MNEEKNGKRQNLKTSVYFICFIRQKVGYVIQVFSASDIVIT